MDIDEIRWTSFWDLSYRDGSYLDHWDPPEVPTELVALIATGKISPPASVLDLGCGAGLEALFLASHGCRVIGLDSSLDALQRARARQADWPAERAVDWCLGSVYTPPVTDGSVDLVLDRGCLHGIDREERPLYATAVDRAIRSGGSLLLRGAREDDDELGVVGISASELDELFPESRFRRGPVVPFELRARAGSLPAVMVWVAKI